MSIFLEWQITKKLALALAAACVATSTLAAETVHYKVGFAEIGESSLVLLASQPLDAERLCASGYLLDIDGAKTMALGVVLNRRTGKVEFAQTLKPDSKFFQNRFVGCFAVGKNIRFVEEVDTQSQQEASQTLIYLASMSGSSGYRRNALWEDGKRSWLIGIAADPTMPAVLVGHGGKDNEANMSIHRATEDSVAKQKSFVMVQHGSFLPGSRVVLDGQKFIVAGRFSKTGIASESESAAASISSQGRYLWSHRFGAGPAAFGGLNGGVLVATKGGNASSVAVGVPAEKGRPERLLKLPAATCTPVAVTDAALLLQGCRNDGWTVMKLASEGSKDVGQPGQKVLMSGGLLLAYSPDSKDGGFAIDVSEP